MFAHYDFREAHLFNEVPDQTRRVVIVGTDGTHVPTSANSIVRYVATYGVPTRARWAYAAPCACAACIWMLPPKYETPN
jgi:hypothetical protein